MFDWNDANEATDDAIIFGPGGGCGLLIVIVVAVVAIAVAWHNSDQCDKTMCPNGQHARLLDHQCLCAEPAPGQL